MVSRQKQRGELETCPSAVPSSWFYATHVDFCSRLLVQDVMGVGENVAPVHVGAASPAKSPERIGILTHWFQGNRSLWHTDNGGLRGRAKVMWD